MDLNIEYPIEYPPEFPEDYKPQVQAALEKAEQDYLRESGLAGTRKHWDLSPDEIKDLDIHALKFICTVVSAFGTQCIRGGWQRDWAKDDIEKLVDDWLEGVIFTVAHTPMASEEGDFDRTMKMAETGLKRSVSWLKFLQAKEKLIPPARPQPPVRYFREPLTDDQAARLHAALQEVFDLATGEVKNFWESHSAEEWNFTTTIQMHVKSTGYSLHLFLGMDKTDGTIQYDGTCDGGGTEWSMDENGKYVRPSWYPLTERQDKVLKSYGWWGGEGEGSWSLNSEDVEEAPDLVDMLFGILTEVHAVREFDELSIEQDGHSLNFEEFRNRSPSPIRYR